MIADLGLWGIAFCQRVGAAGLLLLRTLVRKPDVRKGFPALVEQLYSEGVLSLAIILVSGLFIGMVVGLQGYNTLSKFGASQALGQLLSLSIVRELGPVVTGLLFAGRAGSAVTAEIGLMKATEQLSSLEMMAIDPLQRVVSPRFWAGVISMPILAMIFSMVAIYGGFLVAVQWLGLDGGSFWSNMQSAVYFRIDILNGIIKSLVFGIVVAWIAVFQGYRCVPTSLGIGRATTKTVVYSSLMILGLDFLLTAAMLGGW